MSNQTPIRPIHKAWKTYAKVAVPKDCSQTQYIEMRRAFMAGAASLFELVVNNVGDPEFFEAQPDEREYLDLLFQEIVDFVKTVKDGLA